MKDSSFLFDENLSGMLFQTYRYHSRKKETLLSPSNKDQNSTYYTFSVARTCKYEYAKPFLYKCIRRKCIVFTRCSVLNRLKRGLVR